MGYNTYHAIIESNIGGVYQDGIATKILQHMDRIRNMSDISQARRWVMELLQNARDCSYKDTGVKVRIELKDNELVFSHSGKPFRIKDVLSIINQVTSKASSEETIGQFGTGFMTTFLLSDRVTIHSVLKEEGLPYKPFTISMDRSSNEKDGILAGIAKTMSELDRVDDSQEIIDFDKEGYNTVFSYPLKDSYHYNIAKTGFEDLKETILYVMLFSTPLKEIELISNEGGEKRICYTRGEDTAVTGSALRILTINNEGTLNGEKLNSDDNHILYYEDDALTLAAAYTSEKRFKVFSDKLPRIFADFPLIGAEGFPFPVILNNRNFKAFSGYERHERKRMTLRDVAERAEDLITGSLDIEKIDPVKWLQKVYDACLKEESLNTAIAAGQIEIFPSQDKDDVTHSKLHAAGEIYLDSDIPEIIKDVTEYLDELNISDSLMLRTCLVHKDFRVTHKEVKPYTHEKISEYISRRSARSFPVRNYVSNYERYLRAWHNAWKLLVSCGPDEDFYNMAEKVREELPGYKKLDTEVFGNGMWYSAYCSMLEEIGCEMAMGNSLTNLVATWPSLEDEDGACRWINDFVGCAKRYLKNYDQKIYPNQRGDLCLLSYLKKDGMQYDELKDILETFGDQDDECLIYKRLLDDRVENTLQFIQEYGDRDAASKIGNMIDTLLATGSLSKAQDNYQEACGKLLSWIRDHMDEAKVYFPSYCSEENQMKLLTPHAAVILQRKADDMEDIMKEFGVSTAEDLKKKIKKIRDKYGYLDDEDGEEVSKTSGGGFMPEYDVFYGSDLAGADEDVFREIGIGGEKYALKKVVEYIKEQGFSVITEEPGRWYMLSGISNESGKREDIEVLYADNENYHQAGYDIKVTVSVYGNDRYVEETKVYYLEVKTHTPTSEVRDRIILSDEQMILAAAEGDRYSILNVVYDRLIKNGTDITELKNPVSLIGERKLINLRKGYLFHLNRAA